MSAYYNEHDAFNVQWLKHLMAAGQIASGEIDGRDIQQVRVEDLRGFTQCHFFAGIGVWSYALRCAGWEDSREIWTGSCPCQPFSVSGKRAGASDERHLWPEFFRLIRESRPVTIFGEQVASDDGLAWLDLVSSDMEGQAYTVGAVDTPVCGFGAPHRRQRLYWVADSEHSERRPINVNRADGRDGENAGRAEAYGITGACSKVRNNDVGNSRRAGLSQRECLGRIQRDEMESPAWETTERGSLTNGFWSSAEWIYCRDNKFRPVEAGTFPLAHGIANRVGKLRGYGNALVAPQAEGFIRAYMELSR